MTRRNPNLIPADVLLCWFGRLSQSCGSCSPLDSQLPLVMVIFYLLVRKIHICSWKSLIYESFVLSQGKCMYTPWRSVCIVGNQVIGSLLSNRRTQNAPTVISGWKAHNREANVDFAVEQACFYKWLWWKNLTLEPDYFWENAVWCSITCNSLINRQPQKASK